ncbi:MAG: hypothetical protein QMC93_01885 [Patescibacteria group bacterium]|nr:hypothetical protein [Patescibacteria group bacterium]
MVINTNKNSITISKNAIHKERGMVILPLREYNRLCRKAVLTYYLKGKEAEELDKLVEEGLKEYKEEETKPIKSLADLD